VLSPRVVELAPERLARFWRERNGSNGADHRLASPKNVSPRMSAAARYPGAVLVVEALGASGHEAAAPLPDGRGRDPQLLGHLEVRCSRGAREHDARALGQTLCALGPTRWEPRKSRPVTGNSGRR